VEFTKKDLARSEELLAPVNKAYFQLEYEAKQKVHSTKVSRARPGTSGVPDNRPFVLSTIPVAVMAAVLAVTMLAQAFHDRRSGRQQPSTLS
jgi:hypothetical protein